MQRVVFIQDVVLACLLSQFLMYTAAPWMREQWDSLSAIEEVVDGPIDEFTYYMDIPEDYWMLCSYPLPDVY